MMEVGGEWGGESVDHVQPRRVLILIFCGDETRLQGERERQIRLPQLISTKNLREEQTDKTILKQRMALGNT